MRLHVRQEANPNNETPVIGDLSSLLSTLKPLWFRLLLGYGFLEGQVERMYEDLTQVQVARISMFVAATLLLPIALLSRPVQI